MPLDIFRPYVKSYFCHLPKVSFPFILNKKKKKKVKGDVEVKVST